MMIEINRTQIAVKEYGAGENHCLLLHGNRDCKEVFDRLGGCLAEQGKLHLVAIDYRGHGESEASEEGYQYSQFLLDIDRTLETMGIQKAHIIGHSLGGVLAALYWKQRPQKVKSLVLLATSPYFQSRFRRPRVGEVITARMVQRTNERAAPYFFAAGYQDVKAQILSNWQRMPPRVHEKMIAMGHVDISRVLEEITCRVLAVIGEKDKLCTADTGERLVRGIRHAKLVQIEGTDHYMFMEKPAQTAKIIHGFLDSVDHGEGRWQEYC